MGACDISFTIGKKATVEEVNAAFNTQRKEDSIRNGHQEGYSGDFQTVSGVRCKFGQLLTSYSSALEYCLANSEKWEHAIAVHYVQIDI